jgi:hypothetical protein
LCNMLSSQPMCFNLFGPLVDTLPLATELFKPLYPGEISGVTRVKLEYAPEPASEYLDDHTAFDAYIEYTATDGEKGFIGIETKLVEPFTLAEHEHEAYWKLSLAEDSPWVESSVTNLRNVKVNQLWRDHLLEVTVQHHPKSEFKYGHFLVIYHSDDQACQQSICSYQTLLKSDDRSFQAINLNDLINGWQANTSNFADRLWLNAFFLRYLDLPASEEEFLALKRIGIDS